MNRYYSFILETINKSLCQRPPFKKTTAVLFSREGKIKVLEEVIANLSYKPKIIRLACFLLIVKMLTVCFAEKFHIDWD